MTRRRSYAALALATVVLGLLSRSLHTGWPLLDKSLGDALYAAMAYWICAFVFPARRSRTLLLAAVAFCFAIEAFKLTGLPAAWASWRASRLVFGTTPSFSNLLCYVAGAMAAARLDAKLWRKPPSSSTQVMDKPRRD